MADFAHWVYAAAPSLPFSEDRFLEVYRANRAESISLTLESSALASAIQSLAAAQHEWEGTYTELLQVLSPMVSEETKKSKTWPKNARYLSSTIRKFAAPLRAVGCAITELDRDPKTKRKRIKIEKTNPDQTATEKTNNPNPWVEVEL